MATTHRRSMGVRFGSRRMAENYLFRPAYSKEVYDTLLGLLPDQPRTILDAGCGPGKITFGLVDHVDRVDAIDPSEEMLQVAQSFARSRDPKIRWMCARAEDAELRPPYGLIVAGASIHWMDLDRVLPKFGAALSEGAFLVVLDGDAPLDPPGKPTRRASCWTSLNVEKANVPSGGRTRLD